MSLTSVRSSTVDPAATGVSRQENIEPKSAAPKQAKDVSRGAESRGSPVSMEEVNKVVDSLHELMGVLQTKISFSISDETEQVIVRVTNMETDELIRQIPPEELVALQAKMEELTGIIFNKVV